MSLIALPPERSKFLGGSDAAAALGVSPWQTPLHLYLEKRGELPPPTETDRKRERILARGRREEPNIVNDLLELHKLKITKRSTREEPNRYVDKALPFLAAEIDFEWEVTPEAVEHFLEYQDFEIPRELIGTTQNGEVKTMHPFVAQKKIGDEGTDEIPVEYACQALHGLGVTERELTLFAVAVYTDDPLIYWVRRDKEAIREMRDRMWQFWRAHVEAGVPPEPKNLPDVYAMFGKARGLRREATDEIVAAVRHLETLREHERMFKEGVEATKFVIGKYLLGGEEYTDPKGKPGRHLLTYKGQPIQQLTYEEQERVSVEMLREKFPEAAAACTKRTNFYKFSKPRKGSK